MKQIESQVIPIDKPIIEEMYSIYTYLYIYIFINRCRFEDCKLHNIGAFIGGVAS